MRDDDAGDPHRAEHLPIDVERLARCLAPARTPCARSSPAADRRVTLGKRAAHAVGEVVGEDRGIAGDLLQRRLGCRDDRRAARHRLDNGQPEALVARRKDQRCGRWYSRTSSSFGT